MDTNNAVPDLNAYVQNSNPRPLTLRRFGIELRRMREADKELVRNGRNKEFVRLNHVFQRLISTAEQDRWFAEINSPQHYIMLIVQASLPIGVVTVRDIPQDLSTSTCGAFVWDEAYLSSRVPILSVLTALDFFYSTIGVARTESVVLKHNMAAIKMDRFFGFTFQERDENSYQISMSREEYLKEQRRLISFACRAVKKKETHDLRISGNKSPLNLPQINDLLEA